MLRLTGADRAIAEIAAVAEHVASFTAATALLRIRADTDERDGGAAAAVSLPDDTASGEGAGTLAEVRTWYRQVTGSDAVPAIWQALAHQPKILAATWRKERVVMAAGALGADVKLFAALAVASFRQSDYWIDEYTRRLRSVSDVDDAMLAEVAGAVMHYVAFNTIAHGMRLEAPMAGLTASDFVPGGPLEDRVPGVRKRMNPKQGGS